MLRRIRCIWFIWSASITVLSVLLFGTKSWVDAYHYAFAGASLGNFAFFIGFTIWDDFLSQTGPPGFPRAWNLLAFVLQKRIRARVYEPAHQELLEDYLLARRKYRTPWACRWLTFCFTWRTFWLVVQCFQAVFADKAMAAVGKLVPEPVKRWWLLR
jgi:hypothetical protein